MKSKALALIIGFTLTGLFGCSSQSQQALEQKNPLSDFHAPPKQSSKYRSDESSFDVLRHATRPAPATSAPEVAR